MSAESPPAIALCTDFGMGGPYVGQMQMVIRDIAPGVPVVNLIHDLPAFDVQAAAYLIASLTPWLPVSTIAVCVVDPGVGGARAPLLVRADERWYLGPDNGLFSILARRAGKQECWRIDWRPDRMSDSFHGRDLFAPVAARLAVGAAIELSPAEISDPAWPDDLSEVIYVDGFGNAMTGLRGASVEPAARLLIRGEVVSYARVFSAAKEGSLFWYVNSLGLVELAGREFNAARRYGLKVGSPLVVQR